MYISQFHFKSVSNRDIIDITHLVVDYKIKEGTMIMKKSIEYIEVESPSISVERKKRKMEEIYKMLEESGATSKETAKTSKEINNKLPSEVIIRNVDNVKKNKKAQLNTPSFVGSLSGVMCKFKILGKVSSIEKVEVRWYITGKLNMIQDIDPRDM